MEFRYVVVVFGLLAATGCATTSELEAMKVRLDSSLSATKRSLDSRIQQLESNETKWEELHSQVLRLLKLQEDTVAMIGKSERVDQEHDRLLTAQQDALSKLSNSVKVSTKDITELRAVWQREAGALAQMLEAEEVRYRDGLSSLQRIRSELMSLQGGGGRSHLRKEELPKVVTSDEYKSGLIHSEGGDELLSTTTKKPITTQQQTIQSHPKENYFELMR